MEEKKNRIEIIDSLRGLAVVLMVIHHLLYNFVAFLGAPVWLFSNPVFDILHYIFAGLFIFLSGVSSRFSRDNIKRGSIVIVIAVVLITYVTVRITNTPIWFGILHLLGFSMLFYGLTCRFWNTIPNKLAPLIFIPLIIISAVARDSAQLTSETAWIRDLLWILGWRQPGLRSFDYFPILPWVFVFLLGTWAGRSILERRLPVWFYEAKCPFFPSVGRKALIIYVLHQPVLYPIVLGIEYLMGVFSRTMS